MFEFVEYVFSDRIKLIFRSLGRKEKLQLFDKRFVSGVRTGVQRVSNIFLQVVSTQLPERIRIDSLTGLVNV